MSLDRDFITVSLGLDRAGLVWYPEIGDEVSIREEPERISILVDPQGLTPSDLRRQFVWLPTTEQLVTQFEARQALIYHAGVSSSLDYEAVIKTGLGMIETRATSLRLAFGKALNVLLTGAVKVPGLH